MPEFFFAAFLFIYIEKEYLGLITNIVKVCKVNIVLPL